MGFPQWLSHKGHGKEGKTEGISLKVAPLEIVRRTVFSFLVKGRGEWARGLCKTTTKRSFGGSRGDRKTK